MIAMASANESVSGSVWDAASDCEAAGTGVTILQLYPKTSAFRVERKWIMLCNRVKLESATNAKPTRRRGRGVLLLLVLPYLGLCFPRVYARSTPALWGFPFFYWYQFAWVIATSALLAIVYRRLRT
jgi:membrane protein implicated in regulation of membrane protease activity